jgi:PAS domain S-box-containing protein
VNSHTDFGDICYNSHGKPEKPHSFSTQRTIMPGRRALPSVVFPISRMRRKKGKRGYPLHVIRRAAPLNSGAPPVPGRSGIDDALRVIADGVSTAVGDAFFQSLAGNLAKALRADVVIIGELSTRTPDTIATVAVSVHGDIVRNFEYSLANTPCENVVRQKLRCLPSGVCGLYPGNATLAQWDIESFVGTPLFDSSNQVIGVMVVMDSRPMSDPERAESVLRIFAVRASAELERRRAEEALRRRESLFRLLAENARDIIYRYRLAPARGFEYVSPSVAAVTGYSPEEYYNDPDLILNMTVPGDRPVFEAVLRGDVSTQDLLSLRITRKNGELLWTEQRITPIYGAGGKLLALEGIIRDITERKKLEEELIKKEKLESLGVLAGGIAHDFNNMLTGILGNIGLAKKLSRTDETVSARLSDAEKATFRARDLAKQLLTFSRGGMPVKRAASIGDVITESTNFALRGSRVRCEFAIPADLWTVEVDVGQMSQVIQNLVINADQAMPEGGTVTIRCENTVVGPDSGLPLGAGRYVKICVADRGVGISPENLPKIFDPYFTTKQKGSGLGLTTSYSIIKRHDGHIRVESRPGAGTTFSILIPASDGKSASVKAEDTNVRTGSGRILVTDDEEMVRKVAGDMLTRLGYGVETAGSAAEAVELFKAAMRAGKPFDAVIMDLTMPGDLGGKEAARRLLEIDARATIIVSSGYSNDPVMAEHERHGFKGVITKPYELRELSKEVHRILSQK